jgi:predicted SnoaL-like aldol condensation-catalyzing enzyme
MKTIIIAAMSAILGTATVQAQLLTPTQMKERAVAVLKSLETGDARTWEQFVSAEKYVQHNLAFPDGRAVVLEALPELKKAGTKVDARRVLVDGNHVVLHSEYHLFGGEKIGFDVFRFEDGKIVEHWDNLQAKPAVMNPSGRSMTDGPTEIKDREKTAANKALVQNFITDILVSGRMEKLAGYFDGDNYAQHNPEIGDGLSGLGKALETLAKQGIAMKYEKTHLLIGEGNFVFAASEGTFGGKPTAFFDLWRVENGKIAEHWDVMDAIPPRSEWKNGNGKF